MQQHGSRLQLKVALMSFTAAEMAFLMSQRHCFDIRNKSFTLIPANAKEHRKDQSLSLNA